MSQTVTHHPSSWRDPSGFIFEKNHFLYRQVNISFKQNFDHFIQTGCYEQLVKKGLLIPHEDVDGNLSGTADYYKTLKPERIEFVTYPYEWSFDMLRDAALLTLQLLKEALQFNMILKDATPYNIQWHNDKLIFIDTLSFEKYEERPWIAYRQFCETFLGPLLIMHHSKKQLPALLLAWPEGIPVTTIASLLPQRSRFSLYTYLHIHLHARVSKKKNGAAEQKMRLPKQKLLNLVSSLEILIKKLRTPDQKTSWSAYYDEAAQRSDYLEQKKMIITGWINKLENIKTAADLGANQGEFSELAAEKNIYTIAADLDPYCINTLYKRIVERGGKNIQPMVIDLSNPTPGIGVNNAERDSFLDRVNVDLILALALIHHLAIGKNIPFEMIADTFRWVGKNLIIEFVPKQDEKIKLMLQHKEDIYVNYSETNFLKAFEHYFTVVDKKIIPGSGKGFIFNEKK